jgi:hypothetical protein
VFGWIAAGSVNSRGAALAMAVGPMLPGSCLLLALIAFRGPLAFWYWLWIFGTFRGVVAAIAVGTLLWWLFALAIRPSANATRAGGATLAAAGAALLVLAAILPDWRDLLRLLNRPLDLAPATETLLIVLQAYVGVHLDAGITPWLAGTALLGGGYALGRLTPSRARGASGLDGRDASS